MVDAGLQTSTCWLGGCVLGEIGGARLESPATRTGCVDWDHAPDRRFPCAKVPAQQHQHDAQQRRCPLVRRPARLHSRNVSCGARPSRSGLKSPLGRAAAAGCGPRSPRNTVGSRSEISRCNSQRVGTAPAVHIRGVLREDNDAEYTIEVGQICGCSTTPPRCKNATARAASLVVDEVTYPGKVSGTPLLANAYFASASADATQERM